MLTSRNWKNQRHPVPSHHPMSKNLPKELRSLSRQRPCPFRPLSTLPKSLPTLRRKAPIPYPLLRAVKVPSLLRKAAEILRENDDRDSSLKTKIHRKRSTKRLSKPWLSAARPPVKPELLDLRGNASLLSH